MPTPDSSAHHPRSWFVTGAGRGLGRAFTEAALTAGDCVTGTVRDRTAVADLSVAFADRFAGVVLDVRDRDAVTAAIHDAIGRYGQLDVLVNNAGYGYAGAIEEVTEQGVRDQFDTNVAGALWATQAALPHMRARGKGEIVQVSTVGGVGTVPGLGIYNASKWALEGFSEALANEVGGFGIGVTIAELGSFATDWGRSSMQFAPPARAYDELRDAVFGSRTPWDAAASPDDDPTGEGDPGDAARALLAHLARTDDRPLRLLVGDDAAGHVAAALALRRDDYRRNAGFTWPS